MNPDAWIYKFGAKSSESRMFVDFMSQFFYFGMAMKKAQWEIKKQINEERI